jgi:hypothetical protein
LAKCNLARRSGGELRINLCALLLFLSLSRWLAGKTGAAVAAADEREARHMKRARMKKYQSSVCLYLRWTYKTAIKLKFMSAKSERVLLLLVASVAAAGLKGE